MFIHNDKSKNQKTTIKTVTPMKIRVRLWKNLCDWFIPSVPSSLWTCQIQSSQRRQVTAGTIPPEDQPSSLITSQIVPFSAILMSSDVIQDHFSLPRYVSWPKITHEKEVLACQFETLLKALIGESLLTSLFKFLFISTPVNP